MNAESGDGPQTIGHDRWLEIVEQCPDVDEGMGVKREDARHHASVIATVIATDDEGDSRRFLADMVQVSQNGCMLKTNTQMEPESPLSVECCFDDETVILLSGEVAHSTETVGGFKTGVQLNFG